MKKTENMFGFGGSFVGTVEKIFDIMALGFLWILCSLPVITIGASTTALYYAMVKSVKNNDGYVTKEFFRSFKLNFIPATILWMILAVMTFIMQLNVGILMKKSSGMVGLFFICFYALVSVYLIIVACYAFPALSRFDMNVGWILKISMYMVVRYIFTSIMLVIILVCIGAIVWKLPLLVFFAPGPIAFLMSEFLERVLKKHEPKVEEGGTIAGKGAEGDVRGSFSKYADLTQRAIHVQKTIIRKLADRESCVIIGRSADYILKEQKPILRIFIYSPEDVRIENVMKSHNFSAEDAKLFITEKDKRYHKRHLALTGSNRGDRHNRDMLIDSSLLGVDGTAELIEEVAKKVFHE